MAKMDYQDIITNISQPLVQENVVVAKMDKLNGMFTKNTNIVSGARITDPNCISETAGGGAFTRSDANPTSMTQTFINPYWNKLYYHESAKVRREDLDEAKEGSPLIALLNDASTKAVKQLMNHVFGGVMTQIKSDVDSASAYSDASSTRVTAIQSHEDSTNATITLAYMRAAQKALFLKKDINWGDYLWLFENTVWNSAHPLFAVQGTDTTSWTQVPGGKVISGYQPVATFDQIAVDHVYGMTVGDCFLLDRSDVQIQEHKGLELEWVFVDEYAFKVVARIGVNGWVRHPAFQGKLTNKD